MKIVLQSLEKLTISSQSWYWNWRCAQKVDTEFQYIDFSLAQWKHRFDFSWFVVTSLCWVYWMKVVQDPLKSRLSLHSCGTKIEEVPQKWILNFSTSIPVLYNESIGMNSSGSPWLRYIEYYEWMLYFNPLKSRRSLHSCGTESKDVPQKWILNVSTSIIVLHNESIMLTSAGAPWLRYVGCIEWK